MLTPSVPPRALRSTKNLRSEKSARNLLQAQQKDISVRDENGNDVTPHPLVNTKPSGPAAQKAQQYLAASQQSTGPPSLSRAESQDKMNVSMSISASLREMSMDQSKESGGRSREGSFSFLDKSSMQASGFASSSFSSVQDSYEDDRPKQDGQRPSIGVATIEYVGDEEYDGKPLEEEQLQQSVYMQLKETSTITLLDIPSQCVASDGPFAQIVVEKNQRYKDLKQAKKGSDKYVERAAQTFNGAPKHKEVQAVPPKTVECGTQATGWEVYDDTKKLARDALIHGETPFGAPKTPAKKTMRQSKSRARLLGAIKRVGVGAMMSGEGADERRADQGGKTRFGGKLATQSTLVDLLAKQSEGHVDAGTQASMDSSFMGSEAFNTLMLESDQWLEDEESAAASELGRSRKHVSGEHISSSPATGRGKDKAGRSSKDATKDLTRYPNLPNSLRLVERMVTQNVFHQQQFEYRGNEEDDDMPIGRSSTSPRASDSGMGVGPGGYRSSDASAMRDTPASASRASPGAGERSFDLSIADGKLLWTFFCEHTIGRQVTSLAWNKINHDILAVGYGAVDKNAQSTATDSSMAPLGKGRGEYDHYGSTTAGLGDGERAPTGVTTGSGLAGAYAGADGYYPVSTLHTPHAGDMRLGAEDGMGGLILCWSLKNPAYPERVITTPSPVTTLDFSITHPHLLAAGMYDGTVCVYDVRRTESQHQPVYQSVTTAGQHSDSVWEVAWVQDAKAGGFERFTSVGTDGRVVLWSIKKGLEHQDLMTLKRVVNPAKPRENKGDAFIARHASGLCMAFKPDEPSLYLVGTESGTIHKCSTSYSEQYVDNYFGHAGPVYRLRWSPFHHRTFLSASADWTVKLWSADNNEAPVLSFPVFKDYVSDVCWSPQSAATFACVTGSGVLEVWDLSASSHDPVVQVEVATPNYAALVARQKQRQEQLKRDLANGAAASDTASTQHAPSQLSKDETTASSTLLGRGAGGGSRRRRPRGSSHGRRDLSQEEPEGDEGEAKDELLTRLIPRKLTACLFAHNHRVIVVGDDSGGVSVYRLTNLPSTVKSCALLADKKPAAPEALPGGQS